MRRGGLGSVPGSPATCSPFPIFLPMPDPSISAPDVRSGPPRAVDRPRFPWDPPGRGSVVVCIPTYGAFEAFAQCLKSVLETTPPDARVLVADDASDDPAIARMIEEVNTVRGARLPVGYVRRPQNVGFVHNVNQALQDLAPADVIILNSDCVVSEGWYEGLRRAAYSDTRVATASTLTNHGTIVSVPERNQPLADLPQDWSLEEAARAVRLASSKSLPTLPAAIGHCVYVRRSALELVGDLDVAFAPGYEEEVDFSQRCIRHGLFHVLADDVFVLHYGGSSFTASDGAVALQEQHHRMIAARYPYFDRWVDEVAHASDTPLARSLAAARRALRGMSLTIDGRILTPGITGTQLHVLETIVALHESKVLPLRVIVSPHFGGPAADILAELEHVSLISQEQAEAEPPTDVVHRPYQVLSVDELPLLLRAGERLVITQQDLIALQNPAYHDCYERWHEYRSLTRLALAAADRVAFFTRHSRADAVREELVDPARAKVVLLGTDHRLTALHPRGAPPRGAERLGNEPFLLSLGTDFLHKNRVFAIRLLHALRSRHNWEGRLALAGPHVAVGSSAGGEAEELATRPALSEHVVDLAAVDEAGKRWLMDHAAAVVYPTTSEGFGLVPFEAGEVGVPCLFAPEAALGELLPSEAALLVPWDAEASADRCARLLGDPALQREHVAILRAAAAPLTWGRTANDLLAIYREATAAPVRDTRHLIGEVAELKADKRAMIDQGGYDAYSLALVGRDGALPQDMRRPLLAVANRGVLRALVFPPLRGLYRLVRLMTRSKDDGTVGAQPS
jgi:glycosyltransferase involved in cell wall biosynthesis